MRPIITSFFLVLVLLLTIGFAWAQYDQRNSSDPYMGMDLRTKMALEERDKRLQEQRARGGATGGATKQKGQIQINQPTKKQPPKQQAVKSKPQSQQLKSLPPKQQVAQNKPQPQQKKK